MLSLIMGLALLQVSSSASAKFNRLEAFGDNPGALTASYLPARATNRPLVVLLHGCSQNGEQFSRQSGFFKQATMHDFNLLLPQQNSDNHENLCFNWYSEGDYKKGKGEHLSLINMILATQKTTKSNGTYIAGLSAGGAMANILLLSSPDIFAGGAIIAGIPFPCARDLSSALNCMKQGMSSYQAIPQRLAKQGQPLPKISIWTGMQDKIVSPINTLQIAKQWRDYHQTEQEIKTKAESWNKTTWLDPSQVAQVELIEIEQMTHGIAVNSTIKGGGTPAPYLLEAPISAATDIIDFWQIRN